MNKTEIITSEQVRIADVMAAGNATPGPTIPIIAGVWFRRLRLELGSSASLIAPTRVVGGTGGTEAMPAGFMPAGFSFCFRSRRGNKSSMGKLEKQLDRFLRKQPKLGRGVYIAAGAVVLGDVTLGGGSSVWYNAVLRGDINRIVVGHHTNVQDNAVLHLADDFACIIGSYVTIGHSAVVHACTVGDQVLVGMGAIILDGAVIGNQSIIGAKALVTQGMKIPLGSLVLGAPARVVRALTQKERRELKTWAEKYVHNAAYCLKHRIGVSRPLPS